MWYELLRFLDTIMSPHKEDFMDKVKKYIDFSENEELWKEVMHVSGLGMSIFEEGLEVGIQVLIEDNLEEQIPKERSLEKLQKRFQLTKEKAEEYYDRFAGNR